MSGHPGSSFDRQRDLKTGGHERERFPDLLETGDQIDVARRFDLANSVRT